MPSPACTLVKYSGWEEVRHTDLGIWTPLEFAPYFVGRMRVSTLFEGASVLLLLLGTVFALMGHCNGDHKTLIACGLYILGGLSLGSGLVVFATVLSETFVEATAGKRATSIEVVSGPLPAAHVSNIPPFDYRYGWSFFLAVVAFVLAELAALLSITAYLRRFPTVEDMVREMVPGAERKLREHQRLSSEYLVRHSGPLPTPGKYPPHRHHLLAHRHHLLPVHHLGAGVGQLQPYHQRHQYDPVLSKSELQISEVDACDGGPLLGVTPPDVCATGERTELSAASTVSDEPVARGGQTFAGQTVPITIKSHGGGKYPLAASGVGATHRYGTLPHHGSSLLQGFPALSELGSSSSNSSAGGPAPGRSMTLQHPRHAAKKSVTIGTFQALDTSCPPILTESHGHQSHGGSAV